MPFSGPKCSIWTAQNLFGTNHCYYFHLPIAPFHYAKFKKIFTADPELWQCAIFGPKMVHLLRKFFFRKIIIMILIYVLAPIIVKIFKKFFQEMQSYKYVQFMRPKWPNSPNEKFFRKRVISHTSFNHAYLHAKNQSQIEILMIKEYWNLIGKEPFLYLIWKLDFSQACSFWPFLHDGDFFQKFLHCPTQLYMGP